MGHYFAVLTEKDMRLPLYVAGMGTDDCQQWRTREFEFPYYQIAYCKSGSGVFVAEQKEYKIEPGMCFFFSAHFPHTYYPVVEPWCVQWILFSGANVKVLLQAVGLDDFDVFPLRNPSTYLSCFDNIKKIVSRNQPTDVVEASGCLYQFLTGINAEIYYSGTSTLNMTKEKMAEIINYIAKHCYEDITLGQLANYINVSESYLCRAFRATYGESPLAYVIRYKINEAKKQLLEYPQKKIKDIANELGFHDPSYFGATFKSYEGCTPKQFRHRLSH